MTIRVCVFADFFEVRLGALALLVHRTDGAMWMLRGRYLRDAPIGRA